jgi:hypothetical protein
MVLHFGIPNWQYVFSDVGLDPVSQQWLWVLSPARMQLDQYHAQPRVFSRSATGVAASYSSSSPSSSFVHTSSSSSSASASASQTSDERGSQSSASPDHKSPKGERQAGRRRGSYTKSRRASTSGFKLDARSVDMAAMALVKERKAASAASAARPRTSTSAPKGSRLRPRSDSYGRNGGRLASRAKPSSKTSTGIFSSRSRTGTTRSRPATSSSSSSSSSTSTKSKRPQTSTGRAASRGVRRPATATKR